ncbi:MAG: hypothetical protein AAF616_10135 [Bacteroidota bacterium]
MRRTKQQLDSEIGDPEDLDRLIKDKRVNKRASKKKGKRRNRRYEKKILKHLTQTHDNEPE